MTTFHYQFDLPGLLREVMSPSDYAGLPNEIKFATEDEYTEILQQLIRYFCPGFTMLGSFYAKKQQPREHPRSFIEKKKLLAKLSGIILELISRTI